MFFVLLGCNFQSGLDMLKPINPKPKAFIKNLGFPAWFIVAVGTLSCAYRSSAEVHTNCSSEFVFSLWVHFRVGSTSDFPKTIWCRYDSLKLS